MQSAAPVGVPSIIRDRPSSGHRVPRPCSGEQVKHRVARLGWRRLGCDMREIPAVRCEKAARCVAGTSWRPLSPK